MHRHARFAARGLCVTWMAASCSSRDLPPTSAPPPATPAESSAAGTPPVDATLNDATPDDATPDDAAPVGADACVEVGLACRTSPHLLRGHIEVRADPATLRGELVAYDTSKAAGRHLFVRAKPSACETVFVFDGYAPGDSTFKGKPVARTDHLQRGQIVARLGRTAGKLHLAFDGELRLDGAFDRGTSVDGYDCP